MKLNLIKGGAEDESRQIAVLGAVIGQFNPIICLEEPTYPRWVKKELYPGDKFEPGFWRDIQNSYQWRHPLQGQSKVGGAEIFEFLVKKNLLIRSAGLSELEAIRKKGPFFFRKYLEGFVFGWKASVESKEKERSVPFVCEILGNVMISWRGLTEIWDSRSTALIFRK